MGVVGAQWCWEFQCCTSHPDSRSEGSHHQSCSESTDLVKVMIKVRPFLDMIMMDSSQLLEPIKTSCTSCIPKYVVNNIVHLSPYSLCALPCQNIGLGGILSLMASFFETTTHIRMCGASHASIITRTYFRSLILLVQHLAEIHRSCAIHTDTATRPKDMTAVKTSVRTEVYIFFMQPSERDDNCWDRRCYETTAVWKDILVLIGGHHATQSRRPLCCVFQRRIPHCIPSSMLESAMITWKRMWLLFLIKT
jgi:hypothetical protein